MRENLIIACALAALLSACTTKDTVADKSIDAVYVKDGVLVAEVGINDELSQEDIVTRAGEAARAFGKRIQAGKVTVGLPPKTLIAFNIGAIDRLGHESRLQVFTIGFATSDLQSADFRNLDEDGTLDLVRAVRVDDPLGAPPLKAYCGKQTNVGGGFCTYAMSPDR